MHRPVVRGYRASSIPDQYIRNIGTISSRRTATLIEDRRDFTMSL